MLSAVKRVWCLCSGEFTQWLYCICGNGQSIKVLASGEGLKCLFPGGSLQLCSQGQATWKHQSWDSSCSQIAASPSFPKERILTCSTFLQMAVNLSDGTENFLGEYWYPAVSDFEQIYRNSYSYGKRRLLDRKQSCATSCTQKTGDGQVLQIQLDCELIGEA